jgi:hypothetical protein
VFQDEADGIGPGFGGASEKRFCGRAGCLKKIA